MPVLRHLLGITKLDKRKNQCIRGKNRSTDHSKGNKTVLEKVLQHAQRMEKNRIPKQAVQYRPQGQKNIGRPRKDRGTNFILRINEQEARLSLHEHDDDDADACFCLSVCPYGTNLLPLNVFSLNSTFVFIFRNSVWEI
jgi:hypothetical protein